MSGTEKHDHEIVVIGAGIIGISIAAFLAEAGHKILVIDRSGICEETSSGNAAALAFSDILPLASKGVLAKLPGWLLDPLGPFTIRPSYLPKLVPWLYRFWRASGEGPQANSLLAQAAMMQLAETEMLSLMERAGVSSMLREDGSLELYESEAELKAAQPGWDAREKAGIAYWHIRGKELAEYQPGLSSRFIVGSFVPDWRTVSDPKLLGQALWAYAERAGARFMRGKVESLAASEGKTAIRLADGRMISADKLVVAAGAWSHHLARQCGDAIPLETERGYNTTLPVDSFDLKRQLIFGGHGFVMTPLETGIRVGGAVEFGGLDLAPNFARSQAMLKTAAKFLPGLKTEGGRQWMGYRPSLPDSLPAIGRAKDLPNVFYAFGHGHLGLTQSAATGRLIRDLLTGQTPAIDLKPFNPQRF
ncbi:NAD(P)/FAD-dependent oxidoreductase [Phyllobacterium leguminum]|uniref:Glycine/D-amino acid oxidase-like deaminating enzyme n=1 Tax=Phyllobacterium leguminum TaxID=314237 RepID=A0A318T552_9HYPH|nr:FAD-binding oxidoreductase [Phyllobacterium leguminum]PYE87966.1 glycine/D-amino acid oxidase-like deaminating enzyme [Phyllobacterium leguminum]